MSLYRVRQQRESAQAAATVFPSSSAPRYRCEPHWLAPSATAFHEPEAPCPPCLGGRLRALPRLAASALPPLPSALPPPRPSSRGLRRAHSAAPAGGAAGGKGGAASMGGTPAEQPKRVLSPAGHMGYGTFTFRPPLVLLLLQLPTTATVGEQVRGADSNSLAMTRQSQRDIWLHQMLPPRACQGRRLLLVPWSTGMYHGVGSQVHLMGAFLGLAMLHNHTLIPLANSFDRANHPHCQATGQQGAWECFFFPIVSPDCEDELNRLRAQDAIGECVTGEELGYDRAAQSDQQAVCLDPTTDVFMSYEGRAASLWGDAYLADADMVEHGGHVASTSADTKMVHWWEAQGAPLRLPATYSAPLFPPRQVHWWRAQAVRFMLSTVWHRMSPPSTPIDLAREPYMQRPIVSMHVRQSDKLSEMRVLSLPAHMFLAYRLRRALVDLRHVWLNTEAQVGCVWLNTEAQVGDVLLAAVAARPHVPRILPAPCSGGPPTRVAQHGGTGGWDIHSGTHVLCVVDLPGISPTYQCSPLPSTPVPRMAQSVINETAHYPDWHFLFATNARQPSHSERNREYDAAQSVAASLASALIAAQCDVFLGSLGSNWSRLINELRATGGRLYSGFVVMNLGEW
ncbi:unnamed protein product [Closterium sp. Naga37s-1]|nr:unnamed protein product [Closterium sp. Naga37s-1]